jgi:hypothetical protein
MLVIQQEQKKVMLPRELMELWNLRKKSFCSAGD